MTNPAKIRATVAGMTDDEIRDGLRAVDMFVRTWMPQDEADLYRRENRARWQAHSGAIAPRRI